MAKVVVIGATGHVGTYLVPRLVEAGHEVIAISRGLSSPYKKHAAWADVQRLSLDRDEMDRDGVFGRAIADLAPDIVIDMVCFTLESARQLASALTGRVRHFLHTGTIWTHGYPSVVPTPEAAPKHPFGAYGIAKAEIETYLLDLAHREGFPVTILHPGHIVGPGWAPLNPAGHFNPAVFTKLARGEPLYLPNFGLETVHHVHADDLARQFMAAIANRSQALGESFHAVSGGALTLRGYAEAMAAWFGKPANLTFLPFDQWAASEDEEEARTSFEHIARSPNCSMEKARRLLDFAPRYSSIEAIEEAVSSLIEQGHIRI